MSIIIVEKQNLGACDYNYMILKTLSVFVRMQKKKSNVFCPIPPPPHPPKKNLKKPQTDNNKNPSKTPYQRNTH